MDALQQAISQFRSRAQFAAALGVSGEAVRLWQRDGRVPAERVPAIERLTGVPRHMLRPDLWSAPTERAA